MDLYQQRKLAQLRLLRMHYESRIGHIGGNLSALDILIYLHCKEMQAIDSFVLAKGHAAGALYVSLWMAGALDEEQLLDFHRDGSKLAGHPMAGWHPEILFSTGSLGHGLGLAAGRAFGKMLAGTNGRVFCLMSDGEWQEGSNWEALIFAVHHRLSNLTVFIDANGLQGFGRTADIASLEPLVEKFKPFGVSLFSVDGHDFDQIGLAVAAFSDRPKIIILRTVKGKGISFMENRMEWHYLPLSLEQYRTAVEEIEGRS